MRATVVDALQHNLAPIVPRECVGDRWASAHEASLFDIEAKYGDVMAADDVVEILRMSERRARALG